MNDFKAKIGYILEDPKLMFSMIDFFLGDKIGSGYSRDVFEYNLDKKYVVKIERPDARGDNWAEYRVWGTVIGTTHERWFAEIPWISDDGRIMLQRKTKPLTDKTVPAKVPKYFTDLKRENFGTIGRQVVCHDYSHCIERFGYFALDERMQKFKCHDE